MMNDVNRIEKVTGIDSIIRIRLFDMLYLIPELAVTQYLAEADYLCRQDYWGMFERIRETELVSEVVHWIDCFSITCKLVRCCVLYWLNRYI